MKKKLLCLLTIIASGLVSCGQTSSSSITSDEVLSSSISEVESISSSTSSSEEASTSVGVSSSSSSSSSQTSITSSSTTSLTSSFSEQSSSQTNVTTNPDGSTRLPAPNNVLNPISISDWQEYDFTSSMPDNFSYIYGNNIIDPEIYGDGGGIIMNENSGPRKGFQTPSFDSWIKLEIRINLGRFHGTQKTKNNTDPVFTIYGFSSQSDLVETYTIDTIDVSDNSSTRFYLRNENISYLEIRATNLPSKSNQVYNFGIKGFSIKGWPYN